MHFSIRFRQVMQSSEVFDLVDQEMRKLSGYYPDIVSCTVVIDKPHHHRRHRKGNPIRAHLTFAMPGKLLIVAKSVDDGSESDSALAALSNAFQAAEYAINGRTHKRKELNWKIDNSQLEGSLVPVY